MGFKPGQSGNPMGTKVFNQHLQKQLREKLMHLCPKAIKQLEKMLDDPDHMEFAIKEIFLRVYGKVPESVELSGSDGVPLEFVVNIIRKDPGGTKP